MPLSIPFSLPAGSVSAYAGANAPEGWLFMYGQTVSRATYAALFLAIGTTYGAGDGSTTFRLPDMRGRAAFGKDDMGGSAANRVTPAGSGVLGSQLGIGSGTESHTLTAAQMPSHSHSYSSHNATTNSGGSGGTVGGDLAGKTTGGAGSGSSHPNMPPCLILNYIIKT